MSSSPSRSQLASNIINTFHLVSALLGVAYGAYGSYVFLYLEELTQKSDFNPLNSLLLVLACTMFFEFIAEPISGNFADTQGRKKAVLIAFTLIGVSFLLYAAIAFLPSRDPRVVYGIAIGAEFLLAVGLAFHSGSFEAWFVDSINKTCTPSEREMERYFAHNSQFFTIGLMVGGGLSLTMSRALLESTPVGGTLSVTLAYPWILSCILAFVAMLIAGTNMHEPPRPPLPKDLPIKNSQILNRFVVTLKNGTLRKALIISAAGYIMGIVFMYFYPLLVFKAANKNAPAIVSYLFLLPLLLAFPRALGASLAISLQSFVKSVRHRVFYLSVAASFLLIGLGCIIAMKESAIKTWILLAVSLVFWLFCHACRPVQLAYLNATVDDSGSRAFAISISTALGAAIITMLSFVMISINGVDNSAPVTGYAPVFIAIGIMSAIMTFYGTTEPRSNGTNGTA